MTNEELVERIQQGERDLFPQLWEQVERFVSKSAMHWAEATERNNISQVIEFAGELKQAGYIALVEAATAYSPREDASFIHFLSIYLKKQFVQECAARSGMSRGIYSRTVEAYKKKKLGSELSYQEEKMLSFYRPTSLNTPIGDGPRNEQNELGDLVPDPVDEFANAEERIYQQQLHDKLEEVMETLEQEERRAIKLQYYEDLDCKAVADNLGTTVEHARSLENSALRKLRRPVITAELESYIDRRTPFFLRVGVEAFQSSGESAVERIVMLREQMRERKGGS